jgi:hypothetical protein
MLSREVQARIAALGRAQAAQRREEHAAEARRGRERAALDEAGRRAEAATEQNAFAVWTWATSSQADELRAEMRRHGLPELGIGTWSLRGERCTPRFGCVSIDLVAAVAGLRVHVVRGFVGGRSRIVQSAAELVNITPPVVLDALAADVRDGCLLAAALALS